MATRMRRLLRNGIAATGLFDRAIRKRTFDGVMVLCYHAIRRDNQAPDVMPFEGLHVRRALFRAHCRLLSKLCTPISLSQWRAARGNGDHLPPRPVLVTIDDGYRSVLTQGLSVIEEFQVPVTLFACTEPIARGEMFWYDSVASTQGEEAAAKLNAAPYAEWRAGIERARCRVSPDSPVAPLSVAELEQLAKHPLIEVGGHTHRHPILSHAEESTQREEITENVNAIEQWTGRRPTAFAYPNGKRQQDFTCATEAIVAATGVDFAFATDLGIAPRVCDQFRLPRFTITRTLSPAHLLKCLAWDWQ